ncbi:hypothetical protein [Archangium lansingense]|uniref:Lipoprotein n=1 Tax=Archangium lansingense TaxID=2995310 RepID=A0ABT4A512_9BACT|nr:hypothetical protein [Archangium lansinium]MCY1076740.1 hypothetical protein [Archangium lansinium]
MKRILLSAAVTALLLTPLACNFDQLLAEKVMVGTLLSTPDVDVSLNAMAGLDAGTLPDGGVPEDERLTIPGQTAAFVFFATRNGEEGAPAPIANATVRIEAVNGTPIVLDNKGAGTYSLTTDFSDDSAVKYQNGATYKFVAEHGGNSHVGQVKDAPALERIETLHPAGGYVKHRANQGLTLKRPALASADQVRTLGFVTVVPLGTDGEKGEPTYTNMPKEPLEFLEIVALPTKWQAASLDIPGTAFPAPDSNYLVVFQTVQMGGPETNNLFTGSAMLVGTADVGMVHTE